MNRSFRDAETGVLKAFGFVEENEPGDVSQEEAEDFDLRPRFWTWSDGSWVPCEPGPGVINWP